MAKVSSIRRNYNITQAIIEENTTHSAFFIHTHLTLHERHSTHQHHHKETPKISRALSLTHDTLTHGSGGLHKNSTTVCSNIKGGTPRGVEAMSAGAAAAVRGRGAAETAPGARLLTPRLPRPPRRRARRGRRARLIRGRLAQRRLRPMPRPGGEGGVGVFRGQTGECATARGVRIDECAAALLDALHGRLSRLVLLRVDERHAHRDH